jgi:hypothetical protein
MCGKTGNDKGSVSNGRELTRLSLKGTKTRPFFPGYDRSALHEMRMEMLLQAFLGGWLDGQGGMKTPSSTGRKGTHAFAHSLAGQRLRAART